MPVRIKVKSKDGVEKVIEEVPVKADWELFVEELESYEKLPPTLGLDFRIAYLLDVLSQKQRVFVDDNRVHAADVHLHPDRYTEPLDCRPGLDPAATFKLEKLGPTDFRCRISLGGQTVYGRGCAVGLAWSAAFLRAFHAGMLRRKPPASSAS